MNYDTNQLQFEEQLLIKVSEKYEVEIKTFSYKFLGFFAYFFLLFSIGKMQIPFFEGKIVFQKHMIFLKKKWKKIQKRNFHCYGKFFMKIEEIDLLLKLK